MKTKTIILSVVFLLLALLAAGLYVAYNKGYIRMNYPSFDEYPVQGIDVSHHQQRIDWGKLDKKKVQFAFIKATEGGNHKDSLFQINWREAIRNEIPVAAYHFFTFCKNGEEQARNFIHYVPRDSICLPPVIDLEYGGNCLEANRKQDLIAEIKTFLEIVEDHYKQTVIIYTTNEFYKNYLINRFLDNPIWIRDIISKPDFPDGRDWLFWQYTNKGRIDGIKTMVDLNAFNGTQDDFKKLLK